MYNLEVIALTGCPYSENAIKLLEKNPQVKIIRINFNQKDKFKTKEISTFPQIYLKKENSYGKLLVGGYSEIKQILDYIKNSGYNKTIQFLQNTYPKWSKKSLLRLIEILAM